MKAGRALSGRRVMVLGLARQGTALARWLVQQGAQVTASDVKPAAQLGEAIRALEGLPIRYELGGHPPSLLDQCDLLCLSGGVPIDLPLVAEAQARGIPLANDAQLFVERCPATMIGITGSAGKTTTTTLAGEMCKAAGKTTWVGGNIGNPLIGDLQAMKPPDVVVMELSSFQLELMTSSPQIAAILNITPNHLDRHPSLEAYVAAKARLLDFQSPQDTALLGYDDPAARSLASRVKGKVRWFAREAGRLPQAGGATVIDGHVALVNDEIARVCELGDIRLLGEHNLLNVLAACALAGEAGVSPEAMRTAIVAFSGVAHRLQLVRERDGVRYYDDSIATAPERLIAALQSFHEPIVLLAGGRDKHLPWDEAARLIVERVRQLVVFGEMADLVERAVEAKQLELGASSALAGVHHVETLAEAVKKAAEVARPGDVVLLSPGGTSFDAFKDFAERGDRFQVYVRAL
jgi:UDP-N-acetylmuramoylalanine--D-glutamate ligase